MRPYVGIAPETLPPPDSADFLPRLRQKLTFLDYWARDASFGFNRIIIGQNPDGSGDPLGGDADGGVFFRLLGRPSNQIGHGGTGDAGSLTLSSTLSGVKGKIYWGTALDSVFDEANRRLGIGTASPSATLHVRGSVNNGIILRPAGTRTVVGAEWQWRTSDGGTDLQNYVDEATRDDNDYIKVKVDGTESQFSAVLLLPSPSSTPPAANAHVLRVAYRRTGTGGTAGSPPDFGTGPGIDVAIYKGGILVAGGSYISVAEPEPSGSFTLVEATLNSTQITNLGDYSNLEVWCNWTGSSSGVTAGSEMQISWIEFDCGAATTQTDLGIFDDGGLGVLPTYTIAEGLEIVTPDLSTDTENTTKRIDIHTTDSANVFSVLSNGATTINVPFTTYSASNPIALTLQMDDNVSPNNPMFRVRTNSTNVFTVAYHGGTSIDVSQNFVGLTVDAGTSADTQRWTKGGVTQSFIDNAGAFNGPIVGTGLSTFDHILIDNATASDVLLKMVPHASQSVDIFQIRNPTDTATLGAWTSAGVLTLTAPSDTTMFRVTGFAGAVGQLVEFENSAGVRQFALDASGTVTVSDTSHTDDFVRLQVRAPSTQATTNIFQIIRAYAGGNYTGLQCGFDGRMISGDSTAHGAGVIRLQLRQGSGQSVNMMEVVNTAGTSSLFTIGSTGQLTLADGTTPSKTLKFDLSSSTANADLTLDYRSAVDRSLIWNLSGGTGGNLQFNWAGTVSRAVTIPTTANFTIAGLQLAAQTWTGTHLFTGGSSGATMEIYPTNDITSLIVRAADLSVLDDIFTVYDGGSSKVLRVGNLTPVLNTQSIALWTSGVDVGFSMTFGAVTPTANRVATFPDASGAVVLTSPLNLNNRTTNIGPVTIVPSGVSTGNYLINWYAVVETAAGSGPSNVALSVSYTDSGGVARTETVGSIDTTTLNNKQTNTILINSDGSVAATYSLTFTTASGTPAIDSNLSVTRI